VTVLPAPRWITSLGVLLSSACSAPPSPPESVGRATEAIINGEASVPSQNFVVLIERPTGAGQYDECTGTLVAPNLVLTARHCVSNITDQGFTCDATGVGSAGGDIGADVAPSTLQIYTGLDRPPAMSNPAAIGAQLFHDTSTNLCNHDLALIGLNQSISPSAAGVAALRFSPLAIGGEVFTAIGWGVTTTSQTPAVRQQRSGVVVLNAGPYSNADGDDVPPNEFDVGEATCQGDSGGPAVDDSGAVFGVASSGGNGTTTSSNDLAAGCVGPNTLNFYSQVGAFSSVILQAFDAMGATPTTSGGASLGATCTTYVECASGSCLLSDASGYCTESCATSACPSGYQCNTVSGKPFCEEVSSSGGRGCSVGARSREAVASRSPSSDSGGAGLGLVTAALGLGLCRRRRLEARHA
jgi:hypothetical protein